MQFCEKRWFITKLSFTIGHCAILHIYGAIGVLEYDYVTAKLSFERDVLDINHIVLGDSLRDLTVWPDTLRRSGMATVVGAPVKNISCKWRNRML